MKSDRAFPDHSLMSAMLSLAQVTFLDTLPAGAEERAKRPEPTRRPGWLSRALARLDHWFYRQREKEREAYLAQAQDIADLERRLRQLDRRPYV